MITLDTFLIILATVFATLVAAECGLTLKKALEPLKVIFGGLFGFITKKERNTDATKKEIKKPSDL